MDHEQEAARVRHQIYAKMSYAQKYEQLMELRRFAFDLKSAAIREQYPALSEDEVRRRVAKIFIHATT